MYRLPDGSGGGGGRGREGGEKCVCFVVNRCAFYVSYIDRNVSLINISVLCVLHRWERLVRLFSARRLVSKLYTDYE